MVITTPVFREIKRHNPKIIVYVLASKSNYQVIEENPNVDRIILNHKNNYFRDFFKLLKIRNKIDVCVEFDHSVVPHAIFRLRIINPKKIISVKKFGRYGVSGESLNIYDYYVERGEKEHFRNIWLRTLLPFGVKKSKSHYELYISKNSQNKAINFLENFNKERKVIINLQGAVKGKKIPLELMDLVIKELNLLFNDLCFIFISDPEKYSELEKKVRKLNIQNVFLSYKTNSIIDVAALIKFSDLIISPDTSIVHIASTFNIPIISIHEKNYDSFNLFAPVSDISRTVFSSEKDRISNIQKDELIIYAKELLEKDL